MGLFWMIPDHVKNLWARTNQEKYNEEFEELFRHLFERLESMILSSEYPSMRHSAIHVMTQVAAENLLNFHSQFLDTFVSCTYLEIYKATMEKFKEVTPVNKGIVEGIQRVKRVMWRRTDARLVRRCGPIC